VDKPSSLFEESISDDEKSFRALTFGSLEMYRRIITLLTRETRLLLFYIFGKIILKLNTIIAPLM
jgi:hypothetical protein